MRNMGLRYLFFRIFFEIRKRLGFLQYSFPVKPQLIPLPTKEEWLQSRGQFFFTDRGYLDFERAPTQELATQFEHFRQGEIKYFNAKYLPSDQRSKWHIHPVTGYQYPSIHWSRIADFSKEAGDIKYNWERARFSHLLMIVRHDYHFQEDHADLVLAEILDFIHQNPINIGPQYRCSQEISIRLLNWMFALYYYSNSSSLTEERWQLIIQSIYWQVHHIYQNINFSRIAVRNNHALSETLCLYLMQLLFPTIGQFNEWGKKGKKWFEKEILYQVYDDGTFLQFSMNYHRVVIQLLTYGIRLVQLNGEKWEQIVYDRANASLRFLQANMEAKTGELPNYGMNDGAIFFPLNDHPYRDYRPTLQSLEWVLKERVSKKDIYEDVYWLGLQEASAWASSTKLGWSRFDPGGYYLLREKESFTFLRCGSHRDRPHQADNLHVDIWYQGNNYFRDAGSYLYNSPDKWIKYFNGTEGHNTVMIDGQDQMLKGKRFIWFFWTEKRYTHCEETDDQYVFKGAIRAFRHLSGEIVHHRKVEKSKSAPRWRITDHIQGGNFEEMRQIWHPAPGLIERIHISSCDEKGTPLDRVEEEGWYSSLYSIKEQVPQWSFYSNSRKIITEISLS